MKRSPQKRKTQRQETFKIGDKEDGFIFVSYETRQKLSGNWVGENWSSPESYTRTRINQSLFKIRKRCKLKNIPIDIDLDYLDEIFPNDYKCPISREK